MVRGPYQLLATKRDGGALSEAEIGAVVRGAVDGSWTEGQLAAFLMAAVIRGLDSDETRALTRAMLDSGDRWALRDEVPFLSDKHSTGGVGDKVSLILAPLLAACGTPVAMLTGRGLAHTGGTADKLETIPGLTLDLDRDRCLEVLESTGMAIGVATREVAPADQRFYGLRDATATVDSLPLITASILSKKLATGASGLVLDVKTGNAAVFEAPEKARALAQTMVDTACGLGCPTTALMTDMSQPLGRWVGNAAEVRESLDCLEGRGPQALMEVVYALAIEASTNAGRPVTREALHSAAHSGAGRECFERWVEAQGGDVRRLDEASRVLSPVDVVVKAERSGFLQAVACRDLGFLMVEAGAGRARPADLIDPGVSLQCLARVGDRLEAGDEIARAYLNRENADWAARLRGCFEIGDEPAESPAPVLDRVTNSETTPGS